jgi:hypothetical protein
MSNTSSKIIQEDLDEIITETLLESSPPIKNPTTKFFHKIDANPLAVKYLDNETFGLQVANYVEECKLAEQNGEKIPIVPNEIAVSFMKLVNNLAKSRNFSSYTWLEEMKADAIENCIRYIRKFNIKAETRTGKPEAFSYFTRIAYFAFLRRIKLENTQLAIKDSIIKKYNIDDVFYSTQDDDENSGKDADQYSEKSRQIRDY